MSPLNGDVPRKTKSSTRKTADLSPQEILERNAKERERVHAVNDQYQVSGESQKVLLFHVFTGKCKGLFTLPIRFFSFRYQKQMGTEPNEIGKKIRIGNSMNTFCILHTTRKI